LLHAYLYIRALQVDSEATLRIVIDFAETSFTFDQLITATAALCLEYPDMQEYIAVELLRNVAPTAERPSITSPAPSCRTLPTP